MSIKQTLQARWVDQQAVLRIAKALGTGKELQTEMSPFGRYCGRIDLRGFRFPSPRRMADAIAKDVDFTAADIGAWIEHCLFENVVFDLASLEKMSDQGNTFVGCSFKGTSFSESGVGYQGSQYRACVFEKSDFRRAVATRAEFSGCRFINCELKGMDFNASSFEDCAFEGVVEDVWFRGGFAQMSRASEEGTFGKPKKNRMLNVSFAKAELRLLTITDDCDLSSVIMPEQGIYRRYDRWRERLLRLRPEVVTWAEPLRGDALRFVNTFVHRENQDWMILNVTDIVRLASAEAESKILEFLDRGY